MKKRVLFSISSVFAILATLLAVMQTSAQQFAHPAFERVWDRTDSLVADGTASRSWYWGPEPGEARLEPWTDARGGQRLVEYFDKSRMELNDPQADPTTPFYVTNGLLTVELISGQMQVGPAQYENRYPAYIPMSGDPGDQTTPTYAAFLGVSNTPAGDHPSTDRRGQKITATIDRSGAVGDDPAKASVPNTEIAYYEGITKHNVPRAFWDFLNLVGKVREAGRVVDRPLSSPWFYASGLPISEAYWTKSLVRGQLIDVMIQAYERRVLTYTPTNGPGFQVEMGNIGQHYYNWRYKFFGQPGPGTGTPFNTPVPGSPTVIPTPVSGSPTAVNGSPTAVGGSPTAVPTNTTVPLTPKPNTSTTPSPCEICTPAPTSTANPCEICTPVLTPTP